METQMRGVDFRFDPTVLLQIAYLRGRLLPARTGEPPWFDDKTSFAIEIDSARVKVNGATIAALLNHHVFPARRSPLRSVRVEIAPGSTGSVGLLTIKGKLYGFPFRTEGTAELTRAGTLTVHTTKIRFLGVPARSVMRFLGLSLEKVIDWSHARGVRAQENDLVLSPTEILPAPAVRGRIVAVEFTPDGLTQVFGPVERGPPSLVLPDSAVPNYMYYRGGTLRFGRLTMTPADLLIFDLDPRTRFDFFLDRYNDQLIKGYSRNLANGGLITYMPDYSPESGVRSPESGGRR